VGTRGRNRYSGSGKGVMEGVGGWRRVLSSGVTRAAAAVSQDGAAPWASKPAARWVALCVFDVDVCFGCMMVCRCDV
jgi:hypothetical protein